MATILFDGVAYGMLLFVLACGLAVTLGLMNFVNLAHGAFAMSGGYLTVILMDHWGVPFLACLSADGRDAWLPRHPGDAMVRAAAKATSFLMPAMCMRFWPEWAWLKETIASRRLGGASIS